MTDADLPPRRHLMVGTPCYGGNVTHVYTTSLDCQAAKAVSVARRGPFDIQLLSGDALITRARNTIVTQFLDKPNATHLMFIDADIGFDPEAVFDMLEFDHDLVGGIYPAKTVDWDLIRQNAAANHPDLRFASMKYVVDCGDQPTIESSGHFAKGRYVGNGFMMIRRTRVRNDEAALPASALRQDQHLARPAARQPEPVRLLRMRD